MWILILQICLLTSSIAQNFGRELTGRRCGAQNAGLQCEVHTFSFKRNIYPGNTDTNSDTCDDHNCAYNVYLIFRGIQVLSVIFNFHIFDKSLSDVSYDTVKLKRPDFSKLSNFKAKEVNSERQFEFHLFILFEQFSLLISIDIISGIVSDMAFRNLRNEAANIMADARRMEAVDSDSILVPMTESDVRVVSTQLVQTVGELQHLHEGEGRDRLNMEAFLSRVNPDDVTFPGPQPQSGDPRGRSDVGLRPQLREEDGRVDLPSSRYSRTMVGEEDHFQTDGF